MAKDAVIMMRVSEKDKAKLTTNANKMGCTLAEYIRFAFYNYKLGLTNKKLKLDDVITNDKDKAFMLRIESKLRREMKDEARNLGITLSHFTRSLAKQSMLKK